MFQRAHISGAPDTGWVLRVRTDCFPGLSYCSGTPHPGLCLGQGGQRPGCRTLQPTHIGSGRSSLYAAQRRESLWGQKAGSESLQPGWEYRQEVTTTEALSLQPGKPRSQPCRGHGSQQHPCWEGALTGAQVWQLGVVSV